MITTDSYLFGFRALLRFASPPQITSKFRAKILIWHFFLYLSFLCVLRTNNVSILPWKLHKTIKCLQKSLRTTFKGFNKIELAWQGRKNSSTILLRRCFCLRGNLFTFVTLSVVVFTKFLSNERTSELSIKSDKKPPDFVKNCPMKVKITQNAHNCALWAFGTVY